MMSDNTGTGRASRAIGGEQGGNNGVGLLEGGEKKKGEDLNSLQLAARSAVLHEFHIPRACAVLRVVMGGRQIKGEGGRED